jgi:hypothetical protein
MTSMTMTGKLTGGRSEHANRRWSLSGYFKPLLFADAAGLLPVTARLHGSLDLDETGSRAPPPSVIDLHKSAAAAIAASDVPAASFEGSGGCCITPDATMLGTTLASGGRFDKLMLAEGAGTPVVRTAGDAGAGGCNTSNSIDKPSIDAFATIDLVGASTHTITLGETAIGSMTLHFSSGNLGLHEMQSLPHELFT